MQKYFYLALFFLSSCSFFSTSFENKVGANLSILPREKSQNFKLSSATGRSNNLLVFKSANLVLHVRSINEQPLKDEELLKIIQTKVISIETLFENQSVPYTGEISKSSTCLSHNTKIPQVSENSFQKKYEFNLMATENFVFGSCTESLDIYRTQYLLLLCKKSKKIFEIKLFYPKNEKSDRLDFNCSTGDDS